MSDLDPTEINALAILGADPDVRELAALETLHTMAVLAVQARRMTVEQRAKRLRKLESLEVVTLGEIVDAQQKRAGIELDTEPRDADRWKPCAGCRMPIARGRAAWCDECRHPLCACGCGTRGPNNCMAPNKVARRGGAPWTCRVEGGRKSVVGRPREQLSEAGRKGAAAMSPEQRRVSARKHQAAKSPEQRRAAGLKAVATRKARRASPG